MKNCTLVLLVALTAPLALHAQTPYLLKDINYHLGHSKRNR
jgi:hypothetical protein